MGRYTIMKAYCPIAKKYFLFEIEGGVATNVVPVTKAQYDAVSSTGSAKETGKNLVKNKFENNRIIAKSPAVYNNYKNKFCSQPGNKFIFQCAYCSNLKIEGAGGGKSLEDCLIRVTNSGYDDIGAILDQMKIKYKPFENRFDCDILFINCGTSDFVDGRKLADFVKKGGIAYISDLAIDYLVDAFPDFILDFTNDTISTTVKADVIDPEIRALIGPRIDIFFDLDVWAKVLKQTGEVILSYSEGAFGQKQVPIMMMKKYGQGAVFYTSFHNHEVVNQQETVLLKLLICKQLGVKTGQSVNDISKLVGLNIKVK